jgi:hypothetical protein
MNTLSSARPPVHADGDAAFLQWREKIGGGKLRALIGVPDRRLAEAERGLERRRTEVGFHGVGQFPTQHVTAEPIHHGDQLQKAAVHRNVRDIGAPDVIRVFDSYAA